MKVLVIGGTGFIGHATSAALLAEGIDVSVLARHTPGRPLPGVRYHQGSYADRAPLLKSLEGAAAVIHLGLRVPSQAMTLSPEVAAQAAEDFSAMLQLLQRQPKPPRLIYQASAAVYGDAEGVLSESMTLPPPTNAYTSLVRRIEALMAEAKGLSALSLRCFNVYGWQQPRAGGFLNFPQRALMAAMSGEPLLLYGGGEARRDFIEVSDVARANVLALKSDATGVINIGSGAAISLKELIAMLESSCGVAVPVRIDPGHSAGVPHSQAEIRQARTQLGFSCAISLGQGLAQLYTEALAQHKLPATAP